MSLSASAENLTHNDNQSCDGGSMCLELALEGERLSKAGDCRAGIAFFQAAIQAGTNDLRTLSAIYSQLGNAYFYLGDYNKAMQYHKHDLTLTRTMEDKLGEAKSSGNLGNTLKVMGKFNEAVACCKRQLEISRELGNRLGEGRAFYNLGNVYREQGKQLGRVGQNDPGQFPQEVRDCFNHALSYYEVNLAIMTELGDKQACGRACGNLGNTCYLLGDFNKAIVYHTERLQIARQLGDKAAERRANSNLGNSHIFLAQFESAAEHYKCTLQLAQELGDVAVEAQACYSLGNTYTLLGEYSTAVQYHVRHLATAQQLGDRVGEGRASWSLGNAHAALGNHEKALYFAVKHYEISKELGDSIGVATAQLNISDLRKVLGLPPLDSPENDSNDETALNNGVVCDAMVMSRVRRQSMEQLSLLQLTPDAKPTNIESNVVNKQRLNKKILKGPSEDGPAESFFDLLSRCQSERMDDQRATLSQIGKENHPVKHAKQSKLQRSASNDNKHNTSTNSEAMLELISDLQSERIDSQRASLHPPKKSTQPSISPHKLKTGNEKPDYEFLDMLARVQGSRLEDQRSELPRTNKNVPNRGATVPDEDFFSLILRVQGGRMEDQRATVPRQENRSSSFKNPSNKK